MRTAQVRGAAAVTVALSLLALCGCERDDSSGVVTGTAKPQNIAGSWHGWDGNSVQKREVSMTLKQSGTRVTGSKIEAAGGAPDPLGKNPNAKYSISGTYDQETGVFSCDFTSRRTFHRDYTFIDDNTMIYSVDNSDWGQGVVTEKLTRRN
ncbi:MAG: hypothetical protein HQ559_15425 [Lentisphaerae bacterium]|nr:hypothetical protein [Lentisphaerota bacterium]